MRKKSSPKGVQLVVMVVLSAQSTDRRVNEIAGGLFRAFPSNVIIVLAWSQGARGEKSKSTS